MRQRAWLFMAMGMLLALAFAASASAQSSYLTITPNVVVAGGGQAVTIVGAGFTTPGTATIRLSTREAEPLRNALLDTRGRFSESVPIPPSLTPGTYLVIATQLTDRGRQRGFTPTRAKLHVVASAAVVPPGGSPGGGPPLGLVLGVLALLAIAAPLAARRLRPPHPAARPAADASGAAK